MVCTGKPGWILQGVSSRLPCFCERRSAGRTNAQLGGYAKCGTTYTVFFVVVCIVRQSLAETCMLL